MVAMIGSRLRGHLATASVSLLAAVHALRVVRDPAPQTPAVLAGVYWRSAEGFTGQRR